MFLTDGHQLSRMFTVSVMEHYCWWDRESGLAISCQQIAVPSVLLRVVARWLPVATEAWFTICVSTNLHIWWIWSIIGRESEHHPFLWLILLGDRCIPRPRPYGYVWCRGRSMAAQGVLHIHKVEGGGSSMTKLFFWNQFTLWDLQRLSSGRGSPELGNFYTFFFSFLHRIL